MRAARPWRGIAATAGASTGPQALAAVDDFDPDAALLDIALPEMSGWQVARKVRERYGERRPMLIGISGEYIKGVDKVLSEMLGFDHYLLKPYDPQALLALLAPLRRRPRQGA